MSKTKSKDITSINESISVNRYSNGFMIEYSGQDATGDYRTVKVVRNTEAEVLATLTELFALPLTD